MIKHVALISLGLGLVMSGMVPFPFYREPPGYSRFILDPVAMAQKGHFLDEQIESRNAFVEVQTSIYERLAQGKIALMEACDQLRHAAREIYPRFMSTFCVTEKFNPKQKMAWNVVETFRLDAEDTPSLNPAVQRLQKEQASWEFQNWCRQEWKR